MRTRYTYIILLTWMAVIFFLSSEPSEVSSSRSGAIVGVLTHAVNAGLPQELLTFLTRKAAHIIAYFILGLLMFNVIKSYNLNTKRTILLSVAFTLTYAVSDEIHQLFVPGRSGELRDVLIDTTASTVGIYVYYLIHKRRVNRVDSNIKV